MALTKSDITLQASATMTAGAGDTNGSAVSLSDAYETLVTFKITNGATGPTVAAYAILQLTYDGGSNWYDFAKWTAGTANSGTYTFNAIIPIGAQECRSVFGGNTAQNVTGVAVGSKVTALT